MTEIDVSEAFAPDLYINTMMVSNFYTLSFTFLFNELYIMRNISGYNHK